MAASVSHPWAAPYHSVDTFKQAAQLLQNTAIEDLVAMAAVALLSTVYMLRGTLWDKPDPYLSKMYERPQQKMSGQRAVAATRDVAEKMVQVNAEIVIFWGSQSGTAQRFAVRLAKEIKQRLGKTVLVADLSDYEPDSIANIPGSKLAFFIMSTFGEGDPSDNVHDFYSWIETKRGEPLQELRYMAFGLGNSNYKHYNAVIDVVVESIERLGAKAIMPTGRADDCRGETEEHFLEWKDAVLDTLKTTMGLAEREPVYEPSVKITKDTTLEAQAISHGIPIEQATSRAAARTMSPNHALQIKSSRELFTVTKDRNCLHMEIDLSTVPGLKYKTGDHLAVWPVNPDAEVARLVCCLGLGSTLQTSIHITSLEGDDKLKVPASTTISTLLSHYLEISAAVSRDVVASLVEFAPTPAAKDRLSILSKDAERFSDFTHTNYTNLSRLLEYADSLPGSWSSIPLSFLIEAIPAIRPRYYSISSSSVVQPRQVAITAVVSDKTLTASSENIPGLSTNYLLALSNALQQTPSAHPRKLTYNLDGPQDLLRNGRMFAHIRKSAFKLPTVASRPVIMVAAGTGIAPFRAFLQERATLLKMGRDVGRTILFFGCRNQDHDFVYQDELEELAKMLSNRFSMITAFSRPDQGKGAYVQDRVRGHADEICDLLVNDDTHFYICGSAAMAREVSDVVGAELRERQGWDEERLREFADGKKRSKRWMQDVWG